MYVPRGTFGVGPSDPTPAASVVTLRTKPWPAPAPVPFATNVTVRPPIGVEPDFSVAETSLCAPGSELRPDDRVRVVPRPLIVIGAWSVLPATVSSGAKVATMCCAPGSASSFNGVSGVAPVAPVVA